MQTDLWKRLKNAEKPILLYGMGNGADAVIKRLKKENLSISGVFASDEFVRGQSFHGFRVLTYKEAKETYRDFIVLTAFGTTDPSVIEKMLFIKSEQELYIPDVPVYGDTVFDGAFYDDNLASIRNIEKRFADERSEEVFKQIINFKLSGESDVLFSSQDDENVAKEIIKLKKDAVIFDLGAFNGDTALKFSEDYPDCEKIVAVEPDRRNFERLKNRKLSNLAAENAAVSYLDGVVFFSDEGGRNQSINKGNQTVPSVTIDTLCKRYGVPDFIKFDIEGEELNALIGGENTIKNHKPALMISAYHRGEDLVSLPQKVLSLRDDYKMYIRRFPSVPCWDIYYFFV